MTPFQPASDHLQPAPGLVPPAAAGRPLLLVDDDELNRMLVEAFLRTLGFTDIHLAVDGEEALALCEAHDYALVLMDCVMPVLDGPAATRRLRERGWRMPVIALTANTAPADIALCLEAGMTDHLAKPLDLQRLAATLAHWLPAHAGAAALN